MGKTRSLLRVWPRIIAAPLPRLTALRGARRTLTIARRTLTSARPRALCPGGRRAFGAADRNLAAVDEAGESGGDHALGRLHAARHHGLRLVLLLHIDRAHHHRVVVLGPVSYTHRTLPTNI